jgi:hypothetical protein
MKARIAIPLFALFVLSLAAPLAAQSGRRGPPPEGHHGPPPEALAACTSRAQGAACSFTSPRGEQLTGTCTAPQGLPLACMPTGGPRGPGGPGHGPPPEALTACRDTAVGDACVVDTPHGTIEGTCRQTPQGNACLPAGPPPSDRGA